MLLAALGQAWPPFVLVAALLVIGAAAHRDGLFAWIGDRLERLPGPVPVLFAAACGLLAVTTALLNLDTAVAFAMPVVVIAARRRGAAEAPFVYAALFLANGSSLFLPGSNLTNLLVLGDRSTGSSTSFATLLVPALAATLITAVGVAVAFRRDLGARQVPAHGDPPVPAAVAPGASALLRPGGLGAIAAAVAMVLLANPAPEVAAVAGLVAAAELLGRRLRPEELRDAVAPQVLGAIFAVAVALGVLARIWHGPDHLLAGAGNVATAAIAAGASILINNLPAAVMLSAKLPPHPQALLIGLDVGPNLAVTGSLAAFLWLRTARTLGAGASPARMAGLGCVLAPLAMAGALLTL